jgi:hypothetical protein
MNGTMAQVVAVFSMIVGVALLAVLVSKNAQTPAVISSAFDGFSKALNAATAPVSGSQSFGGGLSF